MKNEVLVIDDESAEENDEFYEFEGVEYHTKSILDPSTEELYKDVEVVSSSEDKKSLDEKKKEDHKIEMRNYEGCPAFSFDKSDDLL